MQKSFFSRGFAVVLLAAGNLAAGLGGCAGAPLHLPTAEDLAPSVAVRQGGDVKALRRGRAVLVTECAACHRLYWPNEYPPEQWRGIVKRMAGRASLSGSQATDLERYLSAASRAGKQEK